MANKKVNYIVVDSDETIIGIHNTIDQAKKTIGNEMDENGYSDDECKDLYTVYKIEKVLKPSKESTIVITGE